MSSVLNEGRHAAEFVVSEANGSRSRENVVVSSGSGKLPAGQILSKSGSEYVPFDGTNADAVLIAGVDATAADVKAAVIVRDAEVNGSELFGLNATAKAALAVHGVIVR